jgi:uncharacterized protein YbjT (DUF2867 family)
MLSLPAATTWNGKLALVSVSGERGVVELQLLAARGYVCCACAAEPSAIDAVLAAATDQILRWSGRPPTAVIVLGDPAGARAALQAAAERARRFDCLIAAGLPAATPPLDPDLARFAATGGRLILFHDPHANDACLVSALQFHDRLEQRAGSLAAVAAFARLFILPAAEHGTSDGAGGWRTDWLLLAEKWLDQRPPRPPDDPVLWRLHAQAPPVAGMFAPAAVDAAAIAESRPVYPHPLRALYKGRGEQRDWRSWYAPGIYRRDPGPPLPDELPQPVPQDPMQRKSLQVAPRIGPVAVVGATGRLGLELVQALRSHGVPVRALARDAGKAARLLPSDVERLIVDVRDAAGFERALRGVRRVVFAASATAGGEGYNTPHAVEYEAVRTLAAAARSLSLEQVLLVSSAACTQLEHIHNLWGDILLWKQRSEQWLRSSGVPYSVLRPTGLRAHPGGQRGIRFVQGDRIALGEEISRADVASLCVGMLSDPQALGKTLEAYNDDSLPPGSWVGTFGSLAPDA